PQPRSPAFHRALFRCDTPSGNANPTMCTLSPVEYIPTLRLTSVLVSSHFLYNPGISGVKEFHENDKNKSPPPEIAAVRTLLRKHPGDLLAGAGLVLRAVFLPPGLELFDRRGFLGGAALDEPAVAPVGVLADAVVVGFLSDHLGEHRD